VKFGAYEKYGVDESEKLVDMHCKQNMLCTFSSQSFSQFTKSLHKVKQSLIIK